MEHVSPSSPSSVVKRLPVDLEGHLVVDAFAGSVRVSGHSHPQIEVRVEIPSWLPAPVVDVDREAGEVYVEARPVVPLGWVPAWAWRGVRIEIRVPRSYSLEIETRAGAIVVSGLECECSDLFGRVSRSAASRVEFPGPVALPRAKRADRDRVDSRVLESGCGDFASRVPA